MYCDFTQALMRSHSLKSAKQFGTNTMTGMAGMNEKARDFLFRNVESSKTEGGCAIHSQQK